MFSLISLGFVLLSVLFFAWIFLFRQVKSHNKHTDKRIKRNVSIYKEQLSALDVDLENSRLNTEDHLLLKTEAARTLLKAADQSSQQPKPAPKWLKASLCLLLLTPFLAFPLYGELGALDDIKIKQAMTALEKSPSQDIFNQQATRLLEDIEKRLDVKSDNPDYRLIAARLAYTLKVYDKAAIHFSVIAELIPDNAEALSMLGQSRYLANQQQFNDSIRQPLLMALKLNPQQATALNLLAMDAYEQKDYAKTIQYWQRLLAQIDPLSPQAQMLQKGITKASEKLDVKDSKPSEQLAESITQNDEKAQDKKGIHVSVTLSEKLKSLDKNLPVFIFAKAASGPPIPLAVRKIQLKDLPITVELNDETAMMPSMRLSQFNKVIIGARVSLSGQPQAAKGDWQSDLPIIDRQQTKNLALVIKSKVN